VKRETKEGVHSRDASVREHKEVTDDRGTMILSAQRPPAVLLSVFSQLIETSPALQSAGMILLKQ